MAEVRAPGKLYIAGEYAVVEPGQPAVLVAIDRYITVRVVAATDAGHIRSDQYENLPLVWHRLDGDLVIEYEETPYSFVLSAIRVVEEAARALGAPLTLFDLDITSELDDASGRKFGLGSSAAVTVATVRAMAQFYGLQLSEMEMFKLALMASDDVQRSGSGGDIAASFFGGWIAYTSFDRSWLRTQRFDVPVAELIARSWPGLSVRELTPPGGLRLLVGWTGTPASTSRLVGDVQARKGIRGVHYEDFLARSAQCVATLIAAFDEGDAATILVQLSRNRELLNALSEHTGIVIETPKLRRLVEIAESAGAAAKSSGAGGGDCGIVLCDTGTDAARITERWAGAGITALGLSVHQPMRMPR
ncbi:phosphomevalonate kinase [Propionibacterium cyclohexanicum]|uniref:phosphomevalonate kinase n=1 Tax=Propionibacterium cyclohexanicum TaxID=64702 RepID=A0A1H9Q167_9ACTN|nr:phosphomevalonate kinase [Propionibacterium cyclohexanicum]SER53623.1 phosphomevalonate kinase [Propionibacterium cyclohexanicum]